MKKEKLKIILGVVLVIILFISTVAISFKLGMNHANYEIKSKENETTKKEKEESTEKTPQDEQDKKGEQEEQTNKPDEEEKEPENDENKIKIVGTQYEEFDNIVRESTKAKELKTVPGYESFYMNKTHTTQPGAWTVGMPERYIFNEDGTYLFINPEFDVGNTEVVRAGTWEISNGKLTLHEKYILTEVNGTFIAAEPGIYGENKKKYIDYDFEVKPSSATKSYTITHIGISSYKQDMNEESTQRVLPDNYRLDGVDWYSLESNVDSEHLGLAYTYYNLIK